MDVKKAGWKILSVHRDEFRFAVPLFLLYFLSGAFFSFGQILAETLFLKAYGAAGLSSFFIYNGLALIVGGTVYNLFLLKIPLQRGYLILIGLFSALILSSSLFVQDNPDWLPFWLYLGNYLFTFFLDMHFFNFIYQYLTLRNSKRILPFLMAGGKLGGIAAGLLLLTVLDRDISRFGIVLWATSGALMVFPILALRRGRFLDGPASARASRELLPDMRLLEKILRRVRISYSSSIFGWSVMAVFVMSAVNQVSEYYFASIFNRAFTTKEELVAFLSVYTFAADLLTLALQLLIVSRIIETLGVKRANYVYPGSFFGFIILCMAYPALPAGIMLRFFRKHLSLLFRTPVFNIIMASAPRDRMAEVKSFITGIVSPAGMIAGGFAIMLISRKFTPLQGYALALASGALYLLLTYFQNSAYISSLKKRLMLMPAPEGLSPSGRPEETVIPEALYSGSDDASRNLPIVEAFFNGSPSMDYLDRLLPHYTELSPETRENMLDLLHSGKAALASDIIAHALRDGEPRIRARALSILKEYPYEERRHLLEKHHAPGLTAERYAREILLSRGNAGIDELVFSKLGEISGAVKEGRSEPIEFTFISQALPSLYYLPHLVPLARSTRDTVLFKQIIPNADRLTREEARRVLHAFSDAAVEHLVNFLSLAVGLRETDRALLLDARMDIPYAHMAHLFRSDEKVKRIILHRLMRRKSFLQKFNYLNYLLCMDVRAESEMRGFIDYEIDTMLYLQRFRRYLSRVLSSGDRGGIPERFLLIMLDDFIELHKHLMLKGLAVLTGVDVDEVYESNLLLRDRDLDGYIMEFIEAAGASSRRAVVVLENASPGAEAADAGFEYDPVEMLETFSLKMRHFVPELEFPARACIRGISNEACTNGGVEEESMRTLLEKIVFMKEHTFFGDLKIHELIHMAKIARELQVPPDTVIISEGDMGEELFLVLQGRVEIYTAGRVLDRLGAGACIGELSIIDKEPRSASVKAVEPTRLLSIHRKDFLLTLKENPAISISMMRVITERLRKMIAAS